MDPSSPVVDVTSFYIQEIGAVLFGMVFLFLYRQSQYKEDLPPDEKNIAEVIIGKQRNGPVAPCGSCSCRSTRASRTSRNSICSPSRFRSSAWLVV